MRNYLQLSESKGNHSGKVLRKSFVLAIVFIALLLFNFTTGKCFSKALIKEFRKI